MVRLAERQRRLTKLDIKFLDLPGERIPLEDGVVDTVVSTFTLCTIPGVAEALRGMGRVPKAGAQVHLFRTRALTRSSRATLAALVGAHSSLRVRRLSRNAGHPLSHHPERIQNRADRGYVRRPISEVVVVLLVGHGESSIA